MDAVVVELRHRLRLGGASASVARSQAPSIGADPGTKCLESAGHGAGIDSRNLSLERDVRRSENSSPLAVKPPTPVLSGSDHCDVSGNWFVFQLRRRAFSSMEGPMATNE